MDAPILMRLFHDTVHTVCCADYDAAALAAWSPPEGLDPAVWRARFAGTRPWVAIDANDTPLGFLELDRDGHIDCCYVDHRRQRRGVGTLLMQHALAVAAATRIARLSAEVSITARPFFAHHGFVVVRPQDVQRNGVTLRNYVMERRLAPNESPMPTRAANRRDAIARRLP